MISQVAVLARARWQMLRNSVKRTGGWADLAAQVVFVLVVGAAASAFGLMLGFGAYRLASRPDRVANLQILFGVVCGLWQLMPLVGEAASPGLNFRELARYPIPFRTFYTLHTLYGLLDPAALIAILWFAFVATGVMLARPEWIWPLLVAGTAFLAVNLMLQRVVFDLLERFTATRKGRERFLTAIVVLGMGFQFGFMALMGGDPASGFKRLKTWLDPVMRYSPPALLYDALSGQLLPSTMAMLAQAVIFGLLLLPLLWRKYLGEMIAETAAPRAAVQVQPGWQLPGLPPVFSAMLEKEVRYLLGQSQAAMGFLMIPCFAVMVAMGNFVQKYLATVFRLKTDSIYPGLAGFLVLTTSSWAYNSFCFENHGFDRWVLAPVRFRQVILAKNTMLASLIMGEFVLITAVLSISPGLPLARVGLVSATVIFALLTTIATGNFFAVWSPSGVDYNGIRTRKVSELGVLGAVLSQFTILGLLFLVFYASSHWNLGALAETGLLLLLIVAAVGYYLFSLGYASRYATAKSDVMASRLY